MNQRALAGHEKSLGSDHTSNFDANPNYETGDPEEGDQVRGKQTEQRKKRKRGRKPYI